MNQRVGGLLVAFVFFWVFTSQGQVTTGTISGTVSDSTGAVLPGAKVVIQNEDTGVSRTVTTDTAGRYTAPSLSLGNYRVTASLEGFQTEVRSGILLTVGRQAVVNFELPVGAITQTVEVTGEAPLVETTQSSVDFLVNDTTVRELPLNGRDMVCYLGDPDIDYVKMAASVGVEGEAVQEPSSLRPALERAKRATADGRPYLLDVHVERGGIGGASNWHPPYSVEALRKRKV